MITILLHSSKTMRAAPPSSVRYQRPQLLSKAEDLAQYVKTLSKPQIAKYMQLSSVKAAHTHELLQIWSSDDKAQQPAIDAFLGDIYSGLQVAEFDESDREYANEHLLILSGLYGGLRALDSIHPYRLEMGYKLPKKQYKNLYDFWGDSIAQLVPGSNVVVNLSAVEYTKALLPHLTNQVITPKFMTISAKTGEPIFVTVHAKIARGAFASWLIRNRIRDVRQLQTFRDLGYEYSAQHSTSTEPVFICSEFKGLGLSVRLTK